MVLRLDASTGSIAMSSLARSLATPAMSEHAAAANFFNAVFAAYLSRVGDSERISIGVTFHNRRSETDRRTIGLFMEVFPLALRVTAAGQPDRTHAAGRGVCRGGPTASAVQRRPLGACPGLQRTVQLHASACPSPLGSLDVRRIHPGHGSNAISLSVEPRGDTYDLWFDVNADVAASSSAQRLAEHLRTLLIGGGSGPGSAAFESTAADAARNTKSARGLQRPDPGVSRRTAGLPRSNLRCRRQATTPNAPALTLGRTRMSYAELNRSANRLARKLRALGASAASGWAFVSSGRLRW